MTSTKRFAALLLALLTAGAFVSCGSGESSAPSAETSGEETSWFNETGLPIVNEPVTLTMLVQKNVSDLGNSWQEKECVQRAQEETGITLEFTEISQAAWSEQIGVILASGEMPDVFVGSISNFAAYTESFLPLNDLIDQYAPNITAFYDEHPELKVAGMMEDGNLYSLPTFQQQGYYTHNNRYAINQDWLDAVGMDIPTTQDDLFDVLMAFKEQDPNGNGEADEIPYSMQGSTATALDANSYGMNFLMNSCGIHSINYVQVDDGVVSFAPTREEYRDFLEYANKLYVNGLIDPDGFVQQSADFLAKGAAGRIGSFSHHSFLDIVVGADKLEQYTPLLPMQDKNGDITITGRNVDGDWFYDYYKISATCEIPEVAIRLYDYVNSSEEIVTLWSWGPEGKVYNVNEDGVKVRVTEFTDGMTNFAQARQTYSTGMSGFWIYPKEMYDSWEMALRDQVMADTEALYAPYLCETMPLGQDKQEVVDRRAEQFTEINTYIQNFTAESIMQGVTDSSWEEHLTACDKLDVATYTQDYQNFYNDKKVEN